MFTDGNYSKLLQHYCDIIRTYRLDLGISNKSCLGQIFAIPKTVKSREISDMQKVFEGTVDFDQILQFFASENQIETPLLVACY
jgi:ribosome-binding protein aMBF1 (putative translation factor)